VENGEEDTPPQLTRGSEAVVELYNIYEGTVDGDADAAVETRIRIGWKKFRQLVPLLHCLPIRIYH